MAKQKMFGSVLEMMESPEGQLAVAAMGRMVSDGVDITDEKQVTSYLASLDPVSLLDTDAAGDDDPRSVFPPANLPDVAAVESSSAQSRLITGMVALAKRLESEGGRSVRQGRMDDALLAAIFEFDDELQDMSRRSIVLDQLWHWALVMDVVIVKRGRFTASKKWTSLDNIEASRDLALGLQSIIEDGLYDLDPEGDDDEWNLQEAVNENAFGCLGFLYVVAATADCDRETDDGITLDDLIEAAIESAEKSDTELMWGDGPLDRELLAAAVADLVRIFQFVGLVEPLPGGTVRLTASGKYSARELLLSADCEARIIGDLADLDGESFLQTITGTPWPIEAEVEAWVARRSPVAALDELVNVVVATNDALVRIGGMSALEVFDVDLVLAKLPMLFSTRVRIYAAMWIDVHTEGGDTLDLDQMAGEDLEMLMTDQFVAAWHMEGRTGVLECLAELEGGVRSGRETKGQLVAMFERAEDVRAAEIISIINDLPPGKTLAKAARRALLKS